MILSEHLQLLMKREGRVVLGRKWFNLWLLTLVLVATFISVAFSNGSMRYLSEKMNDPFTNWVNIVNSNNAKFDQLHQSVRTPEVQQHYGFEGVQGDVYYSLTFSGKVGQQYFLECRFFEHMQSELIQAILSPDNVVADCAIAQQQLSDESLGFIITRDVLQKLGYSTDSIPAYIDYLSYSYGADSLGVSLIEGQFAPVPVPLLAVVRRLPMNMDMIAGRYFYEQLNNDDTYPLNMNNAGYQRKVCFFVADGVEGFETAVEQALPDSLRRSLQILTAEPEIQTPLRSWKPGEVKSVYFGELNTPTAAYQQLVADVERQFDKSLVRRVYAYELSNYNVSDVNFLSLSFVTLDSIRAFEHYAKDNFGVQIEMSQVNAKENFNAVSVMANILSWAMIVFSIVCIVIFIVNMLQSYFQKVKRNLGTFKAFGISSAELTCVYVLILLLIIAAAIGIALLIAWLAQLCMPLLGMLKDGEFNYLSLWSLKTFFAVLIVVLAAIATVVIVMKRLLHQTPGDLIYDRN